MKDLAFYKSASVALNQQTINSDTTTDGVIINRKGYDAVTFLLFAGTVTAGTVTPLIEHSDVVTFGGEEEAVADAFLVGTEAAAALTASNTVSKIGYVGDKQYVRLAAVTTGSANLVVGGLAILEEARHNA